MVDEPAPGTIRPSDRDRREVNTRHAGVLYPPERWLNDMRTVASPRSGFYILNHLTITRYQALQVLTAVEYW